MTTPKLQAISLSLIIESANNPRKHFDPAKLSDLVASMKAHGQLTPALVRPKGKKFELAAGHRRFRAAPRAELDTLTCVVRDLSDVEFIEILTIENDEREDVHPLEQADGYKLLMTDAGYDVAKIAARLQRGHDFVYDRLSLLKLIPALKKHFLEGHFSLGHAVVLAKLTAAQQTELNDVGSASNGRFNGDESGLWRIDYALFHEEDEKAGRWPYQPHSVEELKAHIARHVRFRPEEVELEVEFPETANVLLAAAETGTKVLHITSSYMVHGDARDAKVRTYGERSWERADGLEGSTPCEYTAVGLFVDGKERGTTIGVCVRRDKCLVHWGTEVRAAEKRKKDREKANSGDKAAAKRVANDPKPKDRATLEREAREAEVNEAMTPALCRAARAKITAAAVGELGATGIVGQFVLAQVFDGQSLLGKVDKKKVGTTAAELVRFLAFEFVQAIEDDDYDSEDKFETLKLDVKAIRVKLTAELTPIEPETKAGKK